MSALRVTLLVFLLALPAGTLAHADDGPTGQFQPTAKDRDGDGLRDEHDCAPDDPTRPGRSGTDTDCDGAPDEGGSDLEISGPADGGPDGVEAASAPSTGTAATLAVAEQAADEALVLVRHLPLGRSVAIYRPARRRSAPTLVFAAKDNSGVTVTPILVFADGGTRKLADRSRSVSRGHAWVLRVHLGRVRRSVRRVEFSIAVVDGAGNSYSATRVVRVRGAGTARRTRHG